jgi:putative membrane protein
MSLSSRDPDGRHFWQDVFAIQGSATPEVFRRLVRFTLLAVAICVFDALPHTPQLRLEVAPFEFAGAVLGLLLVLRTNAGYDRWWEGRKLWGGIVNQCRDLAIGALAYGPPEPPWRSSVVRWTVAFAHATRRSLRGERTLPEVAALLGDAAARRLAAAEHMPICASLTIAELLRQAVDAEGLDRFAFLQIERDRAALMDHAGACERILSAPLPLAYSIHIRQFVFVYLVTLPVALLYTFGDYLGGYLMTIVITVLVAYPILSLDQIGVELQNPFSPRRMGHLPLDEITTKIERNLLALLEEQTAGLTTPTVPH